MSDHNLIRPYGACGATQVQCEAFICHTLYHVISRQCLKMCQMSSICFIYSGDGHLGGVGVSEHI